MGTCGRCGGVLAHGDAFCGRCGQPVAQAQATIAASAPVQPDTELTDRPPDIMGTGTVLAEGADVAGPADTELTDRPPGVVGTGTVLAEVADVAGPAGTVLAEVADVAGPADTELTDRPPDIPGTGTVLAEIADVAGPAGTVLAEVADVAGPAGTVLAEIADVSGGTGTVLAEGPRDADPAGTELVVAPPTAGIAPGGIGVAPSDSPTVSIAAPPPATVPPATVPPATVPPAIVPPGVVPGPMPGAFPGVVPGGQVGPPGWLPPVPQRARKDWSMVAAVAVAVVVLAAAGVFAWLKLGRPSNNGARLGAVGGVTTGAPSATGSTSPTLAPSSSAPSPTPTQSSPASTLVPVAAGVANDAQAAAVDSFVTEYFNAINTHNYYQYLSLLSTTNRQGVTLAKFKSGFSSTTDSQEMLMSVTDYGSGVTGATLSFVSHQLPSQSATHSSCTDWQSVTLFLERSGGRYLIGPALPGYQAQYSAC